VYIDDTNLKPGQLVDVVIDDADEYDLYASVKE